jgi:hypothetical protein
MTRHTTSSTTRKMCTDAQQCQGALEETCYTPAAEVRISTLLLAIQIPVNDSRDGLNFSAQLLFYSK